MIQPSLKFNSTKANWDARSFNDDHAFHGFRKDWAWKFEGKVNEKLVLIAIKQWRFLKGYGMKDCKLLDLRESIHSAKLIIIIFRESYMQQFCIF